MTAQAARRLALGAVFVSSVGAVGVAFAAAFPAVLRIPPLTAAPTRVMPPARFSHRTHQTFGCFSCHPSVFPQEPLGFTHDQMGQGHFCGQCHDGRTAFAVVGTPCKDCHAPVR